MNRYRRHDDPAPNPPMAVDEFYQHCAYLGLGNDRDISKALDVVPKTLRRWREANAYPGPVRALMRTQRLVFNAGLAVEFSNGVVIQPLHGGQHGDRLKTVGLM